jgi:hypothetical protein
MHIKRLARKAVFITAAVMVLAGFSAGIAGAASAAPTSTVSVPAVASVGITVPKMPVLCSSHFCTIGLSLRGLYVIQVFNCSPPTSYSRINNPSSIVQMQNNCSIRVYWLSKGGGHGCVNPHSSKGGQGRFGTVTNITTSSYTGGGC